MRDFQLFIDAIKSDSGGEIQNNFKIEFLEMEDQKSWRILHHACYHGRVGLLNLLLSKDCKMDSQTKEGCQPIHLACDIGHIDIVKILIENKCDINATDKNGYQSIHWACWKGHIDIVKILIKNKCDIDSFDNNGYKPIHWACTYGHIDIVKILIANKCDINTPNYSRYQPIHLAFINSHIEIVKILIENKCDISAYDKEGYQPIHWACWKGHIDIVKILIENKCDFNKFDKLGYQPIHWACQNGHFDIVKILVENKFDINAPNKDGNKPIHFACENGNSDIVEILIENNCEMHASSRNGESLIDIAEKNGKNHIVDILENVDQIKSIAKQMDLPCKIVMSDLFCRKGWKNVKSKGELIGSGAFGEVYKYKIPNTNREIAIKRTQFNFKDTKNIEGNINKYSSRIRHKNIVQYFGALMKSLELYIYMEHIPGGSLQNLIDKLKWIENAMVIKFTKQILEGLQFLHSNSIVHRDIKPDNMLLDHDETLKLSDFGLSKSLLIESNCKPIKKAETYCGTKYYMAPEIIMNKPYDFPADIWSTGASIIHLIIGEMPHDSQCATVYEESVDFCYSVGTPKTFPIHYPISKTMVSFINDLLTPEELLRPSAGTLINNSIFKDLK